MQVFLVLVFVVAVAFGAYFFNHGLSMLRADLEPRVPDAPDEVPKKDDREAKATVQV